MKGKTTHSDTYSVKLRLFRGKKTYDENRNVSSDNQLMDAPIYPSFEWDNFIKKFPMLYTGADVVGVKEVVFTSKQNEMEKDGVMIITTSYDEDSVKDSTIAEIKDIVKGAFSKESVIELTPEQKRIAVLEAKLEALTNPSPKRAKESFISDSNDEDDDIATLRAKYKELHPEKKSANGLWKERRLGEEIAKLEK